MSELDIAYRFRRNRYEIELFYDLYVDNKYMSMEVRTLKGKEVKALEDGTISYIKRMGNKLRLSIYDCSMSVKNFKVPDNLALNYILFCKEHKLNFKEYQHIFKYLDFVLEKEKEERKIAREKNQTTEQVDN